MNVDEVETNGFRAYSANNRDSHSRVNGSVKGSLVGLVSLVFLTNFAR